LLASYLARLGITAAQALRRPRLGLLDPSTLPIRIWPTDVDAFGHLNNGRCLTLMDMGRWDLALRAGWQRAMRARGWRPIVGAASVRFRRELRPFQKCDLVTRMVWWDERSFYFDQRLQRGEVVFARAFIRGVVTQGKQVIRGDEVVKALGQLDPPPPPPDGLLPWIESLRLARP
jgi:acyl-CoA thioesterase FadM